MNQTLISHNPYETRSIAKTFATQLHIGDTIALIGPLGAGKTEFVKGIVEGLGLIEDISSPTFTLLHEYTTKKTIVYHLDFYRLKTQEEVYHLGLEDLHDGITLIEWADRFPDMLPSAHWEINITPESGAYRTIHIRANK